VAAHFLREAAELGDAAAQCWLATCYAEGWGVRPDQNEAANLYAVSARSGYARAQNNLAVCYADGIHLTASQPLTEFPKPHHAG
jgi:TPR repeat protein